MNSVSRRSLISLFSTAAVALAVPAAAAKVITPAVPVLVPAPTVPALVPALVTGARTLAPTLVPMFSTRTTEELIDLREIVGRQDKDPSLHLDFHLSKLLPVGMRTMRSVKFQEFTLVDRGSGEPPALEVKLDYWPSKFKIHGITLRYDDQLLFSSKKPATWRDKGCITAAGDPT